ncbi:MAG: hypothetical protein QNI87_13780 [Erythrobacter sp.]|uniref:hypothetical protein n=1 Tax=Erythrobacter sp. TaxID=1042 RepID=UPI00260CF899|nr:hypothetical protein [Erythrobacter sp.]MDJ0979590.1 hypothetical protein [Erythrobacter sp.]
MTFFNSDLYRHVGLGFLIGAALMAAFNLDALTDEFSPPALAAEAPQAPLPAPEFRIQPFR